MSLFVSYSSRDRHALDDVLSALKRAREEVWFDEELGGGEVWWRMILERIRDCEVFLFAMSANSLQSKPCQAELRYAQALGKPILPVQIGAIESMRVTPLAGVEAIDYQSPTIDTGIRLITAVRDARERNAPLPDPLPDEPPVPFAYLMRLATTIAGPDLSPRDQTLLVSELKTGLDEDGHDPAAYADITRLLTTLRDRPDVTYRTRTDIDNLLATLGHPTPTPQIHPGPAHPVVPVPSSQPSRPRSPNKKWVIAAAAAAVIAATLALVWTRNDPTAPPGAPQSLQPAAGRTGEAATERSPDARVIVDGQQLTTTGRPMCVTVSNRFSILIAAPDAASQVMVAMIDDKVDGIVIPIDNNPFVYGKGEGEATATKTGNSSWRFTGEVSGIQSPATRQMIKPFSIEVTCP